MDAHERFVSLAAAAIDFELSPTEAAQLNEHLARCSACRRVAGELVADARVLRRLVDGAPSERVRGAVVSAAAIATVAGSMTRIRRRP